MAAEQPRRRPDVFVVFCIILTLVALAFVGGRLIVVGSQQQAILEELQGIRAALGSRPAPPATGSPPANQPPANITLTVTGDVAMKGSPDAQLTLIEFSDFECPFCARYANETHAQLDREYVQTGKVRYVFRHFPLEQIHSHALKAGVAGECARQQGKFWNLHARLFANQSALGDADLLKSASAIGLDSRGFERCLGDEAQAAKVRRDLNEGLRAGVNATPTFFVGTTGSDGTVQVLRSLAGAQPFATFKRTLDELLAASGSP